MAYSVRLTPKQKRLLKSIRHPRLTPPIYGFVMPPSAICNCRVPVLTKGIYGLMGAITYWCIRCGGELPLRQLDKLYDKAFGYEQLEQVFGAKVDREILSGTKRMIRHQQEQEQENKMLEKATAKEGEGGYDFLTVAEAKRYGGGTVVQAPRLVDTKFGEKLFVDLKIKANLIKTWSANNKSRNFLIDKIGSNEKKFVGKKIDLVVVKQMVEGSLKDVIYAKGAVKEK